MLAARDLAIAPPGAAAPVVTGFDLEVAPGEWVALTGANGGGKTSVLQALAGLWPITAGTLTLDGRPFGPDHREAAAGTVSVVLQDPSSQILQPTVAEELAFGARNLGHAPDDVAAAVGHWAAAFDLGDELDRDPGTLSAGRQQLVLLAAALVARPRLLFADEPGAHLDGANRARVRAAIEALRAQGTAVVWATQDPAEIACATRTIEVGRSASGSPMPPAIPVPGPRGAGVALTVEVAPEPAGPGPRIRTAAALRIEIPSAGITAVTGPNGAGKSVLLLSVAGLEPAPQVTVRWTVPPQAPPIVALQYPELQVFEDLVADEVVFAATARGTPRPAALADAGNALRMLGFDAEAMLARRTWTLSTGEKRLVEVIGALIAPASVVILDEPTAGLDERRRQGMAALVSERSVRTPVVIAGQDPGWLELLAAHRIDLGA